MAEKKRLSGMTGFTMVWIGQFISVLASNMTNFALTIWMYQQTRSATAMSLLQVCFILPLLLLSPVAGAMVDRYNRKLMMMVSDFGAVLATIGILILQASGNLEFWHLYIAAVINGLGNTFQWPAYSAAISTMVNKDQYSRANGMMSLIGAGPAMVSPLLAGALLPIIGLTGILTLDVITFFIAIIALLLVFVPQPEKTIEGQQDSGTLWKESLYGFRYIFKRPSLLGLQLVFFFGNLFVGIAFAVFAPMLLSRTNDNSVIFGSVQSIGAIGGVAGGILMSTWKGFKKRIHGVLLGWIIWGLAFTFLGFGINLWIWGPAMVIQAIMGSMINTSNQAIWQSKVAPDGQGRVFAARRLIAWFTQPIAPIIGGTLADFVLEPAMADPSSTLAILFGPIVGTGPGAGMGILFVICGIASALVGLVAYFVKPIREVESILPDHDQLERVAEPAAS
ncbi:MAG: MFS transporter [Anaerolineaceae bacterium]|nr:MFS transporter [Anaerolineaceae bacterium]